MSAKKRAAPKARGDAPVGNRKSPIVVGVAVAAVVGLIALIAVVATSSKDSGTTVAGTETVEVAPVTVTGPAIAAEPDGSTDPAIGTVAPRLDGTSFDRSAVSLVPGTGPLLIVFVAHWCPHCQREVPLIAAWAGGGTANGVTVRAVSTSVSKERPNYPPSEWLARENFTVPTLVDDESASAATAYGLTSFPYFVALDASGRVVARVSGEITRDQFTQLTDKAKSVQ